MEALIKVLKQCLPNKEAEQDLVAKLSNRPSVLDSGIRNCNECLQLHDALSLSENYVSVLFVLHKALGLAKSCQERTQCFERVKKFLCYGKCTQLLSEYIPLQFYEVVRTFCDLSAKLDRVAEAVLPVESALHAYGGNLFEFTPLHTDYMFISLESKNYLRASQVYRVGLTQVKKEVRMFSNLSLDLMRYFYYCGRICIGLREFQEAIEMLKICITLPASVLSSIVADAYKHYVILCLMIHGQVDKLPKHSPNSVARLQPSRPYREFIEVYQSYSHEKLKSFIKENESEFRRDGTLNLINQSANTLRNRLIQRQTHTFLTTTLEEIAKASCVTTVEEVENNLLEMIESKQVKASIDHRTGTVEFSDLVESRNLPSYKHDLEVQLSSLISIIGRLRTIDEAISLSKDYVKKVTQRTNLPANQQAPAFDMMDISFTD